MKKINSKSDSNIDDICDDSLLDANNIIYLESLYESYLRDPETISSSWQSFFSSLSHDAPNTEAIHSDVRAHFKTLALQNRQLPYHQQENHIEQCSIEIKNAKQVKVLQLINSYRFSGHKKAITNPLDELSINNSDTSEIPELTLQYHDLKEDDLSKEFNTGSLFARDEMLLNDIIEQLEHSYCDVIGAQYMYMSSVEEKRWLQKRLENRQQHVKFSSDDKKNILKKLIAAEGLEHYLHTKYVGQKRFSLEGGDSLIPLLDALIQHAGTNGVNEIVLGMAHRGRLNVLINIMGKSPALLFKEFEGNAKNNGCTGDVKYHLGFASDMSTPGGPVHLALAFNPSHLEIVGPVVEGAVRARQDRRHSNPGKQVVPIVIHGDAAIAGQGVNMETLNMSQTRGYRTHGTIHIVINNQIGFTTNTVSDTRSSEYCTDLAKMVNAPVFHVNGDRPEAVISITKIAVDYRNTFNKDVFIDLVCYRRHGHNEADEPSATQPLMYNKIRALETTQTRYAQQLIKDGIIQPGEVQDLIQEYRESLDNGVPTVPHLLEKSTLIQEFPVNWGRFKDASWDCPANTLISRERFTALGKQLTITPDDFKMNARVASIVNKRAKMAAAELPTDWGFGENLAYAALLQEGFPIRLSGEDCGRGTFFHRHAVFHHQENGESYIPLQHITEDQSSFTVIDSLLSEEAVLAFEYGYATTEADILVIWEAQFGDFANGAQVVIDQFISSAEQKWGLLHGLVMLLPHGYEGMGPEHSSARLERYLQLCAQNNMQVCIPTTPAQVFHMLRRQMIRRFRKPLIVMAPKSLLRHPLAVSSIEEYTDKGFQTIIDETDTTLVPEEIERIVLCSGKIYYELLEKRLKEGLKNIAFIRVEQLYPLSEEVLGEILKPYSSATTCIWCQEEPLNQGAWLNIQPRLLNLLIKNDISLPLVVASRPEMAAPA
ncbi:MAG: 2-oxoglutarate dehydrogenase E1 component, partial [gamma proteobacterium symbiont of Lucinoma myriamae]|nr:2-oxoglutarate dehydrogenase E1 component [gamma proteobacterium symbiont of Lucinoma myriamae]